MYSAKVFYITAIILSLICNTAFCIKCHICSSRTDVDCVDISSQNSTFLRDCTQADSFCRKTLQTITSDSLTIITRDCGWIKFEKHDDAYCMTSNSNFKKEISCQCFEDGCNSSEGLIIPSRVLLLLIVFVTISLSSC